ncbi:MAG TPA: ribose-phosphate pyrophosphokinase [Armatimonadota bacterium]|nr:ribose-phosphate pyrophosphokinase [Armatimonadota bacterium]
MTLPSGLRVLSGTAHPQLAASIIEHIGIEPSQCIVSRFSDGEVRVDIDESVRGKDIFVVQPTCAPVNENLVELLIILDALKRASARRITAVLPYYGYARQDKKRGPREPISARLVADMITVAGASRLLTIDLHVQQIQGFFDFPVDHLPAGPIIADHLQRLNLPIDKTVIVSPDVGRVGAAGAFADRLGTTIAIIVKRRNEPNQSEVLNVIGEVAGKVCVLVDDMIDTGGTTVNAAKALVAHGAHSVIACATHAVLSGPAVSSLRNAPIERLIVTDTIPIPPERRLPNMEILSVAPLLANAITRIANDASVSTLFRSDWKNG